MERGIERQTMNKWINVQDINTFNILKECNKDGYVTCLVAFSNGEVREADIIFLEETSIPYVATAREKTPYRCTEKHDELGYVEAFQKMPKWVKHK